MSGTKSNQEFGRYSYALLLGALLAWTGPAAAEQRDATGIKSAVLFVQSGAGEGDTSSYTIGATWQWNWSHDFSFGRATGYTEVAVGRWATKDSDGDRNWVTQVGITPVIRLHPYSQFSDWFVEGGIGLNLIRPFYQTDDKRFSTEFNFGDHIGIGREFGSRERQEVSVRLQHFSNAGIREPNPGENFVQVRYSSRY